MLYNAFSKNLKQLRISRNLNQVQLSQNLCVTKQTVSNWENDNITPSLEMLIKISEYFNVSIEQLIGSEKQDKIDVSGLSDEQIAHISLLISDFKKLNSK